ncbi:rhamnose ABC transporter substrate-binding protein [Streptomyces odontomachi]|uniref:rhamnose ABC transporter substrate-binding protein n=1 Tax=Streptomyces odontomachi TaxID=2944940 RepID=UPI00210CCE5E|nr:rhamnose ABC transporter substrate-binding protein [Streptomyces sp. ODS25]
MFSPVPGRSAAHRTRSRSTGTAGPRAAAVPSGLRRAGGTLAAVVALALAATACGGTTKDSVDHGGDKATGSGAKADPNAATKKGLKVAFLPKQVNNPYFTVADKGGEKALKQLGSSYQETGPNSATDTSGQVSYVNTLTQQQVDAMAVSAQDPGALCTALKQAMKNGIKIVTYDSDTNPECRNVFISQASAEAIGRTLVQQIAKQIGYRGEIAILSAAQTATNQNTWITYMKDELTEPRYKNMKLVKTAYGNDDAQQSFQQTQGLLQEHPKLAGIISPTTVGIKAAAQYLSGSKYRGKVRLTGLGTPNDMRKYVKNGTVDAFELWDPAKLGALAAHAAVALSSGQITGARGEKLKAGDMGTFTVGAHGVIDLGKPTVFDAKNVDDYRF